MGTYQTQTRNPYPANNPMFSSLNPCKISAQYFLRHSDSLFENRTYFEFSNLLSCDRRNELDSCQPNGVMDALNKIAFPAGKHWILHGNKACRLRIQKSQSRQFHSFSPFQAHSAGEMNVLQKSRERIAKPLVNTEEIRIPNSWNDFRKSFQAMDSREIGIHAAKRESQPMARGGQRTGPRLSELPGACASPVPHPRASAGSGAGSSAGPCRRPSAAGDTPRHPSWWCAA